MKGKRKANGHKEKRGKQAFNRTIHQRDSEHKDFQGEFGHLENDTIVGQHHKSTVITLVERLSKFIITLKPKGRQVVDIENSLKKCFKSVDKNLFNQ